eukprot:CAMPEP_0184693144 /NCGR_PEP_ID=MMETSP0313-20130426/1425_1 /TAXON_ID=2792 /ORGANISM="Porphyridium aerugineum, Strain SAG 1380-2" /LENGTH=299 /DNA_ID=CAMNT_0027151125 /DNA_START=51 /DNA_END=950 /DNA_ORIENTATION=+
MNFKVEPYEDGAHSTPVSSSRPIVEEPDDDEQQASNGVNNSSTIDPSNIGIHGRNDMDMSDDEVEHADAFFQGFASDPFSCSSPAFGPGFSSWFFQPPGSQQLGQSQHPFDAVFENFERQFVNEFRQFDSFGHGYNNGLHRHNTFPMVQNPPYNNGYQHGIVRSPQQSQNALWQLQQQQQQQQRFQAPPQQFVSQSSSTTLRTTVGPNGEIISRRETVYQSPNGERIVRQEIGNAARVARTQGGSTQVQYENLPLKRDQEQFDREWAGVSTRSSMNHPAIAGPSSAQKKRRFHIPFMNH